MYISSALACFGPVYHLNFRRFTIIVRESSAKGMPLNTDKLTREMAMALSGFPMKGQFQFPSGNFVQSVNDGT